MILDDIKIKITIEALHEDKLRQIARGINQISQAMRNSARHMPDMNRQMMMQDKLMEGAGEQWNQYARGMEAFQRAAGPSMRLGIQMARAQNMQREALRRAIPSVHGVAQGLRTLGMFATSGIGAIDTLSFALDQSSMFMWKFMIAAIPLQRVGESILGIGAAAGAASFGLAKLSADFEAIELQLRGLTKSSYLAKQSLEEALRFAQTTPFDIKQTAAASQVLHLIDYDMKQLLETAGTMAAGTMGAGHDIWRAAEAMVDAVNGEFRRLRNTYHMTKEEIKSFANDSIDAMGRIVDKNKFMAGLIQAVQARFGPILKEYPETLEGQYSNLKDTFIELGAAIGDIMAPELKRLIEWMKGHVEAIRSWLKDNVQTVEYWKQLFVDLKNTIVKFTFYVGGSFAVLGQLLLVFGMVGAATKLLSVELWENVRAYAKLAYVMSRVSTEYAVYIRNQVERVGIEELVKQELLDRIGAEESAADITRIAADAIAYQSNMMLAKIRASGALMKELAGMVLKEGEVLAISEATEGMISKQTKALEENVAAIKERSEELMKMMKMESDEKFGGTEPSKRTIKTAAILRAAMWGAIVYSIVNMVGKEWQRRVIAAFKAKEIEKASNRIVDAFDTVKDSVGKLSGEANAGAVAVMNFAETARAAYMDMSEEIIEYNSRIKEVTMETKTTAIALAASLAIVGARIGGIWGAIGGAAVGVAIALIRGALAMREAREDLENFSPALQKFQDILELSMKSVISLSFALSGLSRNYSEVQEKLNDVKYEQERVTALDKSNLSSLDVKIGLLQQETGLLEKRYAIQKNIAKTIMSHTEEGSARPVIENLRQNLRDMQGVLEENRNTIETLRQRRSELEKEYNEIQKDIEKFERYPSNVVFAEGMWWGREDYINVLKDDLGRVKAELDGVNSSIKEEETTLEQLSKKYGSIENAINKIVAASNRHKQAARETYLEILKIAGEMEKIREIQYKSAQILYDALASTLLSDFERARYEAEKASQNLKRTAESMERSIKRTIQSAAILGEELTPGEIEVLRASQKAAQAIRAIASGRQVTKEMIDAIVLADDMSNNLSKNVADAIKDMLKYTDALRDVLRENVAYYRSISNIYYRIGNYEASSEMAERSINSLFSLRQTILQSQYSQYKKMLLIREVDSQLLEANVDKLEKMREIVSSMYSDYADMLDIAMRDILHPEYAERYLMAMIRVKARLRDITTNEFTRRDIARDIYELNTKLLTVRPEAARKWWEYVLSMYEIAENESMVRRIEMTRILPILNNMIVDAWKRHDAERAIELSLERQRLIYKDINEYQEVGFGLTKTLVQLYGNWVRGSLNLVQSRRFPNEYVVRIRMDDDFDDVTRARIDEGFNAFVRTIERGR